MNLMPKLNCLFAVLVFSVAVICPTGMRLWAAGLKSTAVPNPPARPPKDAKLDVAILFDFSAVDLPSGDATKDAAMKNKCDAFAKITREQVYPLIREVTGTTPGKCYKEIQIKVVPNGSM